MNDFNKLPKWAQGHIKDLQRQRDVAVRTLNAFQDSQSKSRMWVEEHTCTGEERGPVRKKHFIQAHSIYFEYGGNKFELALPYDEKDTPHKKPRLTALDESLYIRPGASNTVDFWSESQLTKGTP